MAGKMRILAHLLVFQLVAALACSGAFHREISGVAAAPHSVAGSEQTQVASSGLPASGFEKGSAGRGKELPASTSGTSSGGNPELDAAERGIINGVLDLTAKLATHPEKEELVASLQAAAEGLESTVSRLQAAREAYLLDYSSVMEVLQKYSRARDLLEAGVGCDGSSEEELAERLQAARDAYNTLLMLLTASARRAESVDALTEALWSSQSTAFAMLLKLAKAKVAESQSGLDGEEASSDDLAAIRAAVHNMQDLAAAAEHATRVTVAARTRQTEELAFLLLRRFGHMAGAGLFTENVAIDGGKADAADGLDAQVHVDPADWEQLERSVRAGIEVCGSAEQVLMKDLATEALKTVQHVTAETASANEAALQVRASAAEKQWRSSDAGVALGVLLSFAVVTLICLIVYSLVVIVSFQSKLNAARVGEQAGQAHTED
ncbi:conserved hypothetical protein [Neospora caninum Liverpool]|uniref:Transmembrane protein n=1 Tax=Neospora caninum (strain Liverpool) TaxID=572307 RepID=F0VPI6_NEOCL|nr:conserved hypothetical protein [Neospora caninum Liverpool]CBZ55632.1 conserved hypothetical protein [Neospora caninum Liverpool]CEL70374.1 TPA: hypothetical protein BN1204_060570 [Neospora caninum Liverpool]|eukprot:XP_003885660.1 conserved hypothetical protein [Neospora caninum Liverpool]